jgi:hypothetical protein
MTWDSEIIRTFLSGSPREGQKTRLGLGGRRTPGGKAKGRDTSRTGPRLAMRRPAFQDHPVPRDRCVFRDVNPMLTTFKQPDKTRCCIDFECLCCLPWLLGSTHKYSSQCGRDPPCPCSFLIGNFSRGDLPITLPHALGCQRKPTVHPSLGASFFTSPWRKKKKSTANPADVVCPCLHPKYCLVWYAWLYLGSFLHVPVMILPQEFNKPLRLG